MLLAGGDWSTPIGFPARGGSGRMPLSVLAVLAWIAASGMLLGGAGWLAAERRRVREAEADRDRGASDG